MPSDSKRPQSHKLVGPILRGDLAAIDALIASGTSLDEVVSGTFPPLHYAIDSGSFPVVRRLVAARADVNGRDSQRQQTPLQLAAARGKREAVATLIAAGADVSATDGKGWTALDAAAGCDGGPAGAIVSMLIAAGGPIDRPSRTWGTPLIKAAWRGHPSAAAALLAAGADPNQPTASGTPLTASRSSQAYPGRHRSDHGRG